MQIASTYASTADALAQANGPYVVDAGEMLTFSGGPATPNTTYAWDFGDGSAAAGAIATHAYADDGIYVAKLTTVVHEPGGVTTRQFARVTVRNVPAVVDLGPPITIDEGQVVEYVANFTDKEWPDTHRAIFDFGDNTMPVEVAVTETNTAPLAQGSARVKHAYCDNGQYTVTAQIIDDDGGIGVATKQVTALNVPPTVYAEDMFAYPCTPIALLAGFIDPGWCDTHTATWDFGDCTPVQPAIVHEQHKPPSGTGIAAATHVYHCCGVFRALCTVVDKNDAFGSKAILVRVIDVRNRNFEEGFRERCQGAVANEWEPYVVNSAAAATPIHEGAYFAAEQNIVHCGQRSQRIVGHSRFRAGLAQKIGANPNWDYQVTAWYSLDERIVDGKCRLGVDSAGGADPDSPTIVWSEGSNRRKWTQLAVRVTATERAITIFLETAAQDRGANSFFDDVELTPYPCPLTEFQPPTHKEDCINWKDESEARNLGRVYTKDGFRFTSLSDSTLRLVTWGLPPGRCKLVVPSRGVLIEPPFRAERLVAHLNLYRKRPIVMTALDSSGKELGIGTTIGTADGIEAVEVTASSIAAIRITSEDNECLLVDLCAYRDGPSRDPNNGTVREPDGRTIPDQVKTSSFPFTASGSMKSC